MIAAVEHLVLAATLLGSKNFGQIVADAEQYRVLLRDIGRGTAQPHRHNAILEDVDDAGFAPGPCQCTRLRRAKARFASVPRPALRW